MKYNELGQTGIEISVMGLGTLQFHTMDQPTIDSIVKTALFAGVKAFDTAVAYGPAESMLGSALARLGNIGSQAIICSKSRARIGMAIRTDIESSLKNLGKNKIEIYMLHDVRWGVDYQTAIGRGGALDALRKAREEGIVASIGLSTHNPNIAIMAAEQHDFDVLMLPANILDAPMFSHALEVASSRGIGLLGMKSLAGGALAPIPAAFAEALKLPIQCLFVGIRSLAELEADLAYFDQALVISHQLIQSSDTMDLELAALSKALGNQFCRGCSYCLPCSANIPIPEIFRLWRYVTVYHSGEVGAFYYRRLPTGADLCTGCGQCETKCPYELPIRQLLRAAHRDLTIGVAMGKGQ